MCFRSARRPAAPATAVAAGVASSSSSAAAAAPAPGAGAKTRKSGLRRPVTPDDLIRLKYIADPQIAPSGDTILFQERVVDPDKPKTYRANIFAVALDGPGAGEVRQITSGNKDRLARWSPDGNRIAFISGRGEPKTQIYVLDYARGGEARALTDLPEGSIGKMKWSPDGTKIAFSFREQHREWTEEAKKTRNEKNRSDPPRVVEDWWYRLDGDGYFLEQRYALYIVDLATRARTLIYDKDTLGAFDFDWSPESNRLVIATNRHPKAMIRPWKTELLIVDLATNRQTPVPGLPEGAKGPVRWSPDGKWIAYGGREGEDSSYSTENYHLYLCSPGGGTVRNLTSHADYCLAAATLSDTAEVAFDAVFMWTPDSREILMQIAWHGEAHVASVPTTGGEIRFLTEGQVVHALGNIDSAGRRLALTIDTALTPPEVALGERGGATAPASLQVRRVTARNQSLLDGLEIADIESHWIDVPGRTDLPADHPASRPGRVQLWVMKPVNMKAREKHPAVLEIHGGPHTQYGVGFFHEFQTLAATGYVVVYSNPRGSKGYGRDHCAAIRGLWGGADWEDVKRAAKFMAELPYVDPERRGVMGGSYGGYMTNWAIGHTNEFAGAISDRCVSNLVSMFGNSDYVSEPDRYWPGNAWDRPEVRWEQSPIKYFNNVTTPTLIIHSEGDLRCNIEQSDQVFAALKLKDVPARYVRYPASTSHGMSRGGPSDLRVHRLNEILTWWAKWLSPEAAVERAKTAGAAAAAGAGTSRNNGGGSKGRAGSAAGNGPTTGRSSATAASVKRQRAAASRTSTPGTK